MATSKKSTPTKAKAAKPAKADSSAAHILPELERILRSQHSPNEKIAILEQNCRAWKLEFKV